MQTPESIFTYALSTVEAVLDAYVETWNRHDMDASGNLFAEEADFVNVLGMRLKGRTEIVAAHKDLHKERFARTQIRRLHYDFAYLTREIALVHLRWEMTGDPQAPAGGIRRGLMTHVLVRKDGRWYFRATQNTDIVHVPGLEAHPLWGKYLDSAAWQ